MTLAVYRFSAEWRAGTWTVQSRDIDGLVLHARCLDDVQRKAHDAIARRFGLERWSFEVVVQHALMEDRDLQSLVAGSIDARATANRAAQAATAMTRDALTALEASGMRRSDAQEVLGLEDVWSFEQRRDGVWEDLFSERVWQEPFAYAEGDWWARTRRDFWSHPTTPGEIRRFLALLAEEVGGPDELAKLDDAALPDEAFEWDGIPFDIRPFVGEVVALCDGACDAVFAHVEARTACRRLLALSARQSPEYFRQPLVAERIAAALCWTIGKANELFSRKGPPRMGDLSQALGVSSPSSRAPSLLKAAGFDDHHLGIVRGLPALLVSTKRRQITAQRDRYTT
jgi:hypothetical protein